MQRDLTGLLREALSRLEDHHIGPSLQKDIRAALASAPAAEPAPINMLLYCPNCGQQHVDAPDERTPGWRNKPHRSHLCHGCGCIWRPADVPTNGVAVVQTKGKDDTWGPHAVEAVGVSPALVRHSDSLPQAQRAPITAEWVARMAKMEDGCEVGAGVMVDCTPPATSRDKWFYEQGRLAERDPRTHAAEATLRDLRLHEAAGHMDWLADRLTQVHRENADVDYIRAARRWSTWLRRIARPAVPPPEQPHGKEDA